MIFFCDKPNAINHPMNQAARPNGKQLARRAEAINIATTHASSAWTIEVSWHHVIQTTNIAMGNGPLIDGLPIKHGGSFHGYVK